MFKLHTKMSIVPDEKIEEFKNILYVHFNIGHRIKEHLVRIYIFFQESIISAKKTFQRKLFRLVFPYLVLNRKVLSIE